MILEQGNKPKRKPVATSKREKAADESGFEIDQF